MSRKVPWVYDGPQLLTAREAALRIGVHVATLRRQVMAGRFPCREDGSPGAIRTPGDQLRFFVDVLDIHWPTK